MGARALAVSRHAGGGQFYPTAGHNEALARIEYLVDGRRRLGVLLGERGRRQVAGAAGGGDGSSRDKGAAVVLVDATGGDDPRVAVAGGVRPGHAPREDADVALAVAADRRSRRREPDAAAGTVLLVDDAGQAGPDLMTQFVRLARLDAIARGAVDDRAGRRAGAGGAVERDAPRSGRLADRAGPWTAEDTIGYVQTALVEAGRIEPLFDDDALERCTNFRGGVPRQVARLADYALLAGAAARRETIDAAISRSGE